MNKLIRYILLTVICISVTSCTDDLFDHSETECVVGEPMYVNIPFGDGCFDNLEITTRNTGKGSFDHVITSAYILLFNSTTGAKVYGKYFDVTTGKKATEEEVKGEQECWWIETAKMNTEPGDDGHIHPASLTKGKIRIKSPIGGPFKIYMFANTDARYLQLSELIFDGFKKESDLLNHIMNFKGTPTFRTGMLMCGMASGVNILPQKGNTNETDITVDGTPLKLSLERLDAKIEVHVHMDPSVPNLKSFDPESWEVINLPKGTRLIHVDGALNEADMEYYDSKPKQFEETVKLTLKDYKSDDVSVTDNIFSFYMLENYPDRSGKAEMTQYTDREKRRLKPDGTYLTEQGDIWEFSPQHATYLKIKGLVEITQKDETTQKEKPLFAHVTYYVHLGDFSNGKYDNFNVMRNTQYTYNITIRGINNIITEVKTSQSDKTFSEPQPGAVGDVYIADDKVVLFDAHYSQVVLRFEKNSISDKLTWYVQSPFTPSGGHPKDMGNGTYVTTGLDYKWVTFFRNKVNGDVYSHKNRWYPGDNYNIAHHVDNEGDRLMYVDDLLKYLKNQKKRADEGKTNDFKTEDGKDYIYVTAFINEFYYEKHPITGKEDGFLWNKFVNCSDRLMHILSATEISKDKESTITHSVATLKQMAIQTPYANINLMDEHSNPLTGWGCETIDESGFDNTEGTGGLPYNKAGNTLSEVSTPNGLFSTNEIIKNDNSWYTYMNINGDAGNPLSWELPDNYINNLYIKLGESNTGPDKPLKDDVHFLRGSYRDLRYSFVMRNRDNNGNGVIDDDELRWYVPSLNQLMELYMGNEGLSTSARLYPIEKSSLKGNYSGGVYDKCNKWRHHLVSSTIKYYECDVNKVKHTGITPQIFWAEEGISISCMDQDRLWGKPGAYTVKCVRNLGNEVWSLTDKDSKPDDLIVIVQQDIKIPHYKINASRINRAALRAGGEVDPFLHSMGTSNENDPISLLPLGFEVHLNYHNDRTDWIQKILFGDTSIKGDLIKEGIYKDGSYYDYDILKYVLDNRRELYYPKPSYDDGLYWRLPNLREIAILSTNRLFTDGFINHVTSTYFSHGFYGDKKDANARCWFAGNDFLSTQTGNAGEPAHFIFVRDWQPPMHLGF